MNLVNMDENSVSYKMMVIKGYYRSEEYYRDLRELKRRVVTDIIMASANSLTPMLLRGVIKPDGND
jgi:hypothetical protein